LLGNGHEFGSPNPFLTSGNSGTGVGCKIAEGTFCKLRGGFRYSKLPPHRAFVLKTVATCGDITMPELADVLLAEKAITVAPGTLQP
jgi:hypothetical protein